MDKNIVSPFFLTHGVYFFHIQLFSPLATSVFNIFSVQVCTIVYCYTLSGNACKRLIKIASRDVH